MRYVSTRGKAAELSFEEALLAGLATDGGLYVPEQYPTLPKDDFALLAGAPYAVTAYHVLKPFMGDMLPDERLRTILFETYKDFAHPATVPLKQIGDGEHILELFHGPTLAFKDLAMQLLGRLFDAALEARGEEITILGATSGDTGGAAIEAMRGRKRVRIFILHPLNRVSEVQRRQMTTVQDENVYNLAVEGTFDDCQRILKNLFTDLPFREEVGLAGVNSINWARAMAQIVYYVTAGITLGAPHRAAQYAVPTGNFGDVLAGYVGKQMGLPISQLIIATNQNDILARTLETATYATAPVAATMSPSIDIQVSSNFERLLFDVLDRDADRVAGLMAELKTEGRFEIPPQALDRIRADFSAGRAGEAETLATMRSVYETCGEIVDPHTAVGIHVGREKRRPGLTPLVHLATAHPAKFPDAVEKAIGKRPSLPPHLSDLYEREERFQVIENAEERVKEFMRSQNR